MLDNEPLRLGGVLPNEVGEYVYRDKSTVWQYIGNLGSGWCASNGIGKFIMIGRSHYYPTGESALFALQAAGFAQEAVPVARIVELQLEIDQLKFELAEANNRVDFWIARSTKGE